MKTPDITPAQIISAVLFVVGQLVAFGLLSQGDGQLAASIATTVVPVVWTISDMLIRRSRAANLTAILVSRQPENQPLPEPV